MNDFGDDSFCFAQKPLAPVGSHSFRIKAACVVAKRKANAKTSLKFSKLHKPLSVQQRVGHSARWQNSAFDLGLLYGGLSTVVAVPITVFLRFAIRSYQVLISPFLPQSCRFYPSCSQYSLEALQSQGLWRGMRLAVWRVLRCHPWVDGGYDPVPAAEHDNLGSPNFDVQRVEE